MLCFDHYFVSSTPFSSVESTDWFFSNSPKKSSSKDILGKPTEDHVAAPHPEATGAEPKINATEQSPSNNVVHDGPAKGSDDDTDAPHADDTVQKSEVDGAEGSQSKKNSEAATKSSDDNADVHDTEPSVNALEGLRLNGTDGMDLDDAGDDPHANNASLEASIAVTPVTPYKENMMVGLTLTKVSQEQVNEQYKGQRRCLVSNCVCAL